MSPPDERGSALVEYLAVALLLLLPLTYLVWSIGSVQSAELAVQGAAHAAARAAVTAPTSADVAAQAYAATAVALASIDDFEVEVACSADPCLTPDAQVIVSVTTQVPLPGIGWLGGSAQVEASFSASVPRFREAT